MARLENGVLSAEVMHMDILFERFILALNILFGYWVLDNIASGL